jgi:WD40 repeat protein
VGFSPSSRFITYVTNDQKINVVELTTGKSYNLIDKSHLSKEEFTDEGAWGIYDNHKYYYDRITAIAFSETETLLATAGHSTMGLKGNLLSKMSKDECIEHSESIPKISVLLWDLGSKQIKYKLTGHEGGIGCYVEGIAYSNNSLYLVSWGPAGIHSQSVLIWNLLDGKLLHQFKLKEYSIKQIIFSPDNQQIAVTGELDFYIYDLINGTLVTTIPFPGDDATPDWITDSHDLWRENYRLKETVKLKLT